MMGGWNESAVDIYKKTTTTETIPLTTFPPPSSVSMSTVSVQLTSCGYPVADSTPSLATEPVLTRIQARSRRRWWSVASPSLFLSDTCSREPGSDGLYLFLWIFGRSGQVRSDG